MMSESRGEPLCPRCGSSDLTYKNVFDYYKCNKCDTTFITPVYSYGEDIRGFESARYLSQQLFDDNRPAKTPEAREERPAVPVKKTEKKNDKNNVAWLVTLITICILALIAVAVWWLFPGQIKNLMDRLMNL
jgi:hypothetical protein